jgi:Pyruvate/2-oxoacid:ferredoxin oxidoreductase gamma subunit
VDQRREVLLLGAAGQYINTAGEVLCLAGMSGGLQVSQKNDYPITVLRGHSICEVVLEPESIGYTGISKPSVVIAVSVEGVTRRKGVFALLEKDDLVIKPCDLDIPTTDAQIIEIDCREQGIKPSQMALAALAALAGDDCIVTLKMLQLGLAARFTGKLLEDALGVLKKMR